jgi:hypothetical protein
LKQNRSLIYGITVFPLPAVEGFFRAILPINSVFHFRFPLRFSPPAPVVSIKSPLARWAIIGLIDVFCYETSTITNTPLNK